MEAVNIDNLAKLITFSSYANANSDTNIDIVNPIPVSNATSIIDIHEAVSGFSRSEERRVGKDCSSRWSPNH